MRSRKVGIPVVSLIGYLSLLHISLKLYAHCTSKGDAYVLELRARLYGFSRWLSDRSCFPNVRWGNTKIKILYGIGHCISEAKALLLYAIFDDSEERWEVPSMRQVKKVWIAPYSHIRCSIPITENKKVLHSG